MSDASDAIEHLESYQSLGDDEQALKELNDLDAAAASLDGEPAGQSDIEDIEQSIPTSDLLLGILSPAFDILAPNWNVKGNEKQAIAEAYGGLIDKYFPEGNFASAYSLEISAVLVTATVFGSRIGTPRNKPEEKTVMQEKQKQQPQENEDSPSPPTGSQLGAGGE